MGHTFSPLKIETTKLPLLYPEPYLASFTPRHKKPTHSSSGKTSSEFDLLEIKIKEKIKWESKGEQSSVFYFLKNYTKFVSEKNSPDIFLKRKLQYREAIHSSC